MMKAVEHLESLGAVGVCGSVLKRGGLVMERLQCERLTPPLFWNIVMSNLSVTCVPLRKARRDSSTAIVREPSVLFRDLKRICNYTNKSIQPSSCLN
jgi:hypothetical protein